MPDCGKDPYAWNEFGGHYERRFNMFCELYNHDINDVTYHNMWCDQTPLYQAGLCGGGAPAQVPALAP
jgi:hypothetical protein